MLLRITMLNIKMKITRNRFNRVEAWAMDFIYSIELIHLVNKYLLNAYFVPGSILGPRDVMKENLRDIVRTQMKEMLKQA